MVNFRKNKFPKDFRSPVNVKNFSAVLAVNPNLDQTFTKSNLDDSLEGSLGLPQTCNLEQSHLQNVIPRVTSEQNESVL